MFGSMRGAHRGGFPGGGFPGGGFPGGGFPGGGFPGGGRRGRYGFRAGGPRARRGNVRAAILSLLAERSMHGYEMIQELETRSGGMWRPSAGSIYPTLQLLEDEGLVTAEEVEGRRRFSLTDDGRRQVDERRSDKPPWEQFAEGADAPPLRLRDAAFQVGAAAMQAAETGSDEQVAKTLEVLTETRRRIYSILAEGE